jgi:hypothetical protein
MLCTTHVYRLRNRKKRSLQDYCLCLRLIRVRKNNRVLLRYQATSLMLLCVMLTIVETMSRRCFFFFSRTAC